MSKYGVRTDDVGKEERTVDGILFASKRESKRYCELRMLLRAGIITDLELQKKYEFRVNGVKICTYIADFVYLDQSGREVVEDVKGCKTAMYRLKAKLMIACHGLRVLET